MRSMADEVLAAVDSVVVQEYGDLEVLEVLYLVAVEDRKTGQGLLHTGSCLPVPDEAREMMLKTALERLKK
ncbi:MAG: hypothetical protein PHW63_11350 [Alphaproteobacteria bacterium]|nr:hypothetical protein [Alphaproteobacteria bacterium]